MTVQELIKKLESFPINTEVVFSNYDEEDEDGNGILYTVTGVERVVGYVCLYNYQQKEDYIKR